MRSFSELSILDLARSGCRALGTESSSWHSEGTKSLTLNPKRLENITELTD